MVKSMRQRLVDGDRTVTLRGVKYKRSVFDLGVENIGGQDFLVATRCDDGKTVRIPHYQVTLEKLPSGLDNRQQNLWFWVREEFAPELKELEAEIWSGKQAARAESILKSLSKPTLPSSEVDVWLPEPGTSTSRLVSPKLQLVETRPPENPAEAWLSAQLVPSHLTDYLPRLNSCHLTAWDKTEGLLYWPSAVGMVLVLRTKASNNRYRLTLEQVPVGHQLHCFFTQEKLMKRKVSVQVGLEGPVITAFIDPDSAEQFFAQCLEELSRKPGQQRVA